MNNSFDLQFSHLGIFVTDLELMTRFYGEALGMVMTDRGNLGEIQLVFFSTTPDEHHQLVLAAGRPAEIDFNVVNQISFRLGSLGALQALHKRLAQFPVTDIQPVTHGISWSVYCRDPEGNRIELFVDSPWYVDQPIREPFDLDRDEDEILRETEAFCRALPGFTSREKWQAKLRAKIEARNKT